MLPFDASRYPARVDIIRGNGSHGNTIKNEEKNMLLNSNTKLSKPVDTRGNATPWLIRGLTLAPSNYSGKNVCPHAGACREACVLWFAGRTVMKNVRDAALRRTQFFHDNRAEFLRQLSKDITSAKRSADKNGARLAIRLNTASDIVWERIAPEIFDDHKDVTFYDYTKYPARLREILPINYFLSHSVSERSQTSDIADAFRLGRNVVITFDTIYRAAHKKFGRLPNKIIFENIEHHNVGTAPRVVVDGDALGDLRHPTIDGNGNVVGLRGKGGARLVSEAVDSGFIVPGGSCGHEIESSLVVDNSETVSINLDARKRYYADKKKTAPQLVTMSHEKFQRLTVDNSTT